MQSDEIIKTRIETVLPILNERQRRIYLAVEAKSYGWGGKSKISRLSSVARKTITKGLNESFEKTPLIKGNIRKKGGGQYY